MDHPHSHPHPHPHPHPHHADGGPLTIGMKLDHLLSHVDSLTTTQLYGLIVLVTVGLCIYLLGTGNTSGIRVDDYTAAEPLHKAGTSTTSTSTTTTTKVASTTAITKNSPPQQHQRQPRWHIFHLVNGIMICGFVMSVAHFGLHASQYISSNIILTQFLCGWSMFLCYFFGFFGVGIIHQDLQQEQESEQTTNTNNNNKEPTQSSETKTKSVSPCASPHRPTLHKAASCTPVCSDPCTLNVSKSKLLLSSTMIQEMDNADIVPLVLKNQIKDHELEKVLDPLRAVQVRRMAANEKLATLPYVSSNKNVLDTLPFQPSLDYSRVHGANCEIVIGYVPIPVGLVGPLTLNGESIYVPMATTEGCLVASTNRGAKAITQGGIGAMAQVIGDGITRAPCVRLPSAMEAANLKLWCQHPTNFTLLKRAFESTTSFGKLTSCTPTVAGKNVYLRLTCVSGDAMGMNMVSKGSMAVIEYLKREFPLLELVALSGNMCTDKKAAATNWLHGRGKSVVVEATIPKEVVHSTLKTSVPALVYTNTHKNLIGSAMAGSLGGFNAHASNIVTAIFLATGQDPAQNVESSNCITLLEELPNSGDLWISCTMPSIEVGTVGGGTSLEAQATCLKIMGCQGSSSTGGDGIPGQNAKQLAMIVAAATMAGELSLLSALAANTLVQAHMTHNRKPPTTTTTTTTN